MRTVAPVDSWALLISMIWEGGLQKGTRCWLQDERTARGWWPQLTQMKQLQERLPEVNIGH